MRSVIAAVVLSLAAGCGSSVTDSGAIADAGSAADSMSVDVDSSTVDSDAAAASPHPLGTVDGETDVACTGAPTGAVCKHIVVHCGGLPDLGATVAVVTPPKVEATVVAFSGGGGVDFYGPARNALLATDRFRLALVKWDSDWEQTPSSGILAAACRPATALQWVFDSIHGKDRTHAFCATGHSGGSGQISYSLAHYGRGDILDYAALSAGPPFGRIDYGCAPATYSGPPRALCSLLPDAVLPLPDKVDGWENTTTCGSATPDPADVAKWKSDSVVSPGAVYAYPATPVEFFVCTYQPNGTTGGAYFYSKEITTKHAVFCFDGPNDGCKGEGLGNGVSKLVDQLIVNCVPHHAS
jgi:hypothetical protein